MKDLNLSKSQLAELVGVSRAYIGDLANGTAKTKSGFYRPKPEIIAGLAKALKVPESEILNSLGYATKTDDELVADGVFSGYYDLPPERQKLARKQIAALIRSLKDEDFED